MVDRQNPGWRSLFITAKGTLMMPNRAHPQITLSSRFPHIQQRYGYLDKDDHYLFALDKPEYRFNIIGVGMNGQEHVRVTMLEGRATVHGIFDPNPGSVVAAKKIFSQYADPEELVVYDSLTAVCHDPAVDGLIICTPNYTHSDVIAEAIKSGKHILLEKPMATTLPDAHTISRLAEAYEPVFQVGLQYRYKANYVEAIHEALERRSVGNIKMITLHEHRMPFMDKVGQWNKFSEYSGGTLVEKCCHYFDLMNLFAESRPVNVHATGQIAVNFTDFEYNGRKSDILDSAFVTVTYQNGVQGGFNLCMFAPMFCEELVVCGDRGRLRTYENVDFLPTEKPQTYLEVKCGQNGTSRVATPCYPVFIEQSGHHGATFYEHVHFVNQIKGLPSNAATANEGFWSIVVAVAAQKSISTGQVIAVDDLLQRYGILPGI
jgi:myo-inositol 2-dehydrogenase/D-chiro-inositol 1-dehydrogenase